MKCRIDKAVGIGVAAVLLIAGCALILTSHPTEDSPEPEMVHYQIESVKAVTVYTAGYPTVGVEATILFDYVPAGTVGVALLTSPTDNGGPGFTISDTTMTVTDSSSEWWGLKPGDSVDCSAWLLRTSTPNQVDLIRTQTLSD